MKFASGTKLKLYRPSSERLGCQKPTWTLNLDKHEFLLWIVCPSVEYDTEKSECINQFR